MREDDERLNLTDPKAIRALAHPVRWALLEALGQAGTLTATQASEMLGESPANCAFHLRTLAKYGFVEEAGGGRGRERPWRRSYDSMSWTAYQDEDCPGLAGRRGARSGVAGQVTGPGAPRYVLDGPVAQRPGDGARRIDQDAVPHARGNRELFTELRDTFDRLTGSRRYKERKDPKLRPADAIPIDLVLLGYPVLDLPPVPGEADEDGEDGETWRPGRRRSEARPPRARRPEPPGR